MYSGFLHNLLGAAGVGLDKGAGGYDIWRTDLCFSMPFMNLKCLTICRMASARLVVLSFQSF